MLYKEGIERKQEKTWQRTVTLSERSLELPQGDRWRSTIDMRPSSKSFVRWLTMKEEQYGQRDS